jgi:hypothetical protein
MPIVSKAQQRFMFAHQHDQSKLGNAARDFIEKTPEKAYAGLPERVQGGKPDYRAQVLASMAKRQS